MSDLPHTVNRRGALRIFGLAAGAVMASKVTPAAARNLVTDTAIPRGAQTLDALTARLAAAPRRREFKRVPFMVFAPEFWDHEAAAEVLSYRGKPTQTWENSDISAA